MKLIAILLACIFFSGCASNKNDPVATYRSEDAGFSITMTGKRENMAHDPISLLFRGSSPASLVIFAPRITGEVRGTEIPVQKGYYSYLGSVKFSPPYMDVDLSYDDTDLHLNTPTDWNGRYLLRESVK
jgi:hypothetical protein